MTALLALTLMSPAHAGKPPLVEGPLPTDGFVVALPQGDAIGDGATPVTVHVLALKGDGSPMDDLEVKLKSKVAKEITGWSHQGGGLYAFEVVPPRIQRSEPLWISIKGKTADKAYKVDLAAKIPMRPRPPLALTLTANPVELVSGERDEATLSFTIADGSDLEPEMLQIRCSLGEIGELAAMGGGRYVAKLDVQKVTQPGLSLITVSDERRPDRVYGTLVVPVFVKRDVTLRARSGSNVLLKVDDREYGPVEAKRGRAVIPDVLLPPGLQAGTQVTVRDGETEETEADLGVPADRRVQLVPTFAGLPADPEVTVPLRVKVVEEDGSHDSDAELTFETDAGEVTAVTHEGYGVYMAELTPALSAEGGEHELTVTVDGDEDQRDSLRLTLTPARPAALSVTAEPAPLGEAREATLTATITGPGDVPLAGRPVRFNLTGAKADGAPRVGADGQVTQAIDTFGGPVEVLATAPTPAAGNHIHQVVLLPTRSWLPGDTISSTMLTVVTLDVHGYPVADVPVKLFLESGDGSLPSEVTTDEAGLAQVFYTAGSDQKLIRIRAEAGRGSAATALLQGDAVLEGIELPVSGSEAHRSLTEAWAGSVASERIEVD